MIIFTISKSSWRLLGVDCEVDGVSSKKKSIFGLFDSVVAEFEGEKHKLLPVSEYHVKLA